MLPPGATVSGADGKAQQETMPDAPPVQPQTPDETEVRELAPQSEPGEETQDTNTDEPAEQLLRPLGGGEAPASGPAAPQPGAPRHGLSDDATQTSVDVSQYMGADDSIFRPLERQAASASMPGGADPLSTRGGRKGRKAETVSDIPENTRLMRSLIAGTIICLVLAVAQLLITGDVKTQFYFLQLGRGSGFFTALKYGLLSGLLMGLGLGAVLTRFKRGPFLGFLIGLAVGAGLGNSPWGLIAGGLTGILAGRFATVGLRQVVNV
jgi:hypothetical protein